MSFKEILETLPTIEHLTGLNVMDGEWTLIGNHAQAVIEWEQLQ